MVTAVRRGTSIHEVAKRFGVSRSTVQRWIQRAGKKRLDRVDWSDRPAGRREPINKTSGNIEALVLGIRRDLKERSALGEYGAVAISREMKKRRVKSAPSIRTIGRILERRGALDGRKRTRRPAPPSGWYLPDVADWQAEVDCFDIVEGLVIQGGIQVEVLNGISLRGGLVASWPRAKITAKSTVNVLTRHWRALGLPGYAQFDNDTVFQGPHHHPDTLGRVTRFCLSLGVTPVFAPPRETGFQAAIENFNGRWQSKVWSRFHFPSRLALLAQCNKFVTASRRRSAERIANAPPRAPFSEAWKLDLQAPPQGVIVFLRRTNATGKATVLGHTFSIDRNWLNRLVRAEVDLAHDCIRFYPLRRRDPTYQPLLREAPYHFPQRKFHE